MTNERKVAIKTVTVISDRLPQPSGTDGNVLTEVGGVIQWAPASAATFKVAASATDTTPGRLLEKLSAGGNISLALEGAGGDEKVRLSFTESEQADLQLAVDPVAGSDTPSEDRPATLFGGDFTAFPFATLQAAVDSLPNPWKENCQITLAAGVHPGGFTLQNLQGNGGILIHSVELEVEHSNATGGSNRTLQDTSKSWATDEHAGRFLLCPVLSGVLLPILGNTADTITLAAHGYIGGILPGSVYWIYDMAATIDGDVYITDSLSPTNGLLLQLVKLGAGRNLAGAGICLTMDHVMVPDGGLNVSRCSIVSITQCSFAGGAVLLVDVGALQVWESMITGSPQCGLWVESVEIDLGMTASASARASRPG
jgi:hypothetical protein